MFFVLSKVLDFLISPFSWIIILFFIGFRVKSQNKKHLLFLTSFCMLLFFSNPFIIINVQRAWEIPSRSIESIKQPYDIGIVMGGSMRYYDQQAKRVVYSTSVDRLLQAMELYHSGKIKKILLTGGSGFVNFQDWKESGLIAKVLLKSGVKQEDIILENNSRNTYENAEMSAVILKQHYPNARCILITSAFHMRRSLACFKKAGITMDPFSVDVRSGIREYTLDKIIEPNAENIWAWDTIIHEWVGMGMYFFVNYI